MRRARIPQTAFCLLLILAGSAAALSPIPAAVAAPARAAAQADTSAIAAAIGDEARGTLGRFYAERDNAPLWAETGRIGPAAQALIGFLDDAAHDGLKPSAYRPDRLRDAVADARSGDPAAVARAELLLSDALVRYVRDQRRPPRVKMIYADGAMKPKRPGALAVLRAAALTRQFGAYVESMGWMNAHYVRMRDLIARAEKTGATPEALKRIRLNRERTRALPGGWTHHIVVDAASARLWYYEGGKQLGVMRVVVGAPETETPMMAGMLHYATLNPYWNVPDYLAQKSIAPKILAGRTLASMRMEALSDWSADAQVIDAASIDWPAVAAGKRDLRLRQLPGASNSMGRVKFMFPNKEGIYLHDTPERALLKEKDRHFSNGCIRLEDAAKLGRWLLRKPITTASRAPEQYVPLPVPVPVYLTYLTATPTERGVGFLTDVYGRD